MEHVRAVQAIKRIAEIEFNDNMVMWHLLKVSAGIYLTATLSAAAHVEHILSVGNQRLHLLGLLKYQDLSSEALH